MAMALTQPNTRAEQDIMRDTPVKVGDIIYLTFRFDPKNAGTVEFNKQLDAARVAFRETDLGKKSEWDIRGTTWDREAGWVRFRFNVTSNPFPLIWAIAAAAAIIAAASWLTLDKVEHVSKSPVAATLAFGLVAIGLLALLYFIGFRWPKMRKK